jgi:hypothetical protein
VTMTSTLLAEVLLPTLMLFFIGALSAGLVFALVRRRVGYIALSVLGILVAAMAFWRLMDVWAAIPIAMLAYICGTGLAWGAWVKAAAFPRLTAVRLLGGNIGLLLPCAAFLLFTLPFRMRDDISVQTRSPDQTYTATLCYKDGLTFGYQHITIDAAGWHLFGGHADVVEVASEGIVNIAWQGNRTLVVEYRGPRYKGDEEDAYFVTQDHHWRDVQILYKNVTVPESSTTTATP